MTGYPDFNHPAFRACAKALREEGWKVVDPSEHFGGRTDLPRHKFLAADVQSLMECGAVVLLPGWSSSPGALLEAQIGADRSYQFYLWFPHVKRIVPTTREDIERELA
jgi:hypothetical protein